MYEEDVKELYECKSESKLSRGHHRKEPRRCQGEMRIISFIDRPEVIIHSKRNSLAL